MAISFVQSTGANGNSSTPNGTIPSGVQADDQLIALVQCDTVITAVPSGWTEITSVTQTSRLYAYRKTAGASESNPSWTQTSSGEWVVCIGAYRGVDTTSPIRSFGTGSNPFDDNGSATASSTNADDWLVFGSGNDNGVTSTAPTGMTERQDLGGTFRKATLCDEGPLATGGSKTRTNTWTGFNAVRAWLLALAPAPAAGRIPGIVTPNGRRLPLAALF